MSEQTFALPEPDASAMAHSHRLRSVIEQRIAAADGCLPFSDYMQSALYEPGLGYYMAGAAKFGASGDFITAPEVSPLFGQAMAAQMAQVLTQTGGAVLELGAGSGKLALSVMQSLHDTFNMQYLILEPSAELARRQQQLLSDYLTDSAMQSVRWLEQLPTNHVGVIVANEVMDALPVERFRASGTLERHCVSTGFKSQFLPASHVIEQAVATIEKDIGHSFAAGYESEICLALKPWVRSLADSLQQGVVLLADYGYPRREFYLPERVTGTLACYYQHRMHDNPYHLPGLQDITAHVDFTAVAEAAVEAEMDLLGYASQSAYLLDNELLELAEKQLECARSEAERILTARAVKVLTLPGEMGERFQIMALGKGYDNGLRGFRTQDLTHRL